MSHKSLINRKEATINVKKKLERGGDSSSCQRLRSKKDVNILTEGEKAPERSLLLKELPTGGGRQ